MKIRQGFVSNSSSSSFVVRKEYLIEEQLEAIRNHIEYAKENLPNMLNIEYTSEYDEWNVNETNEDINMFTIMDNFDMHYFLCEIGVKEEQIEETPGF
jgi:hypothetical protein